MVPAPPPAGIRRSMPCDINWQQSKVKDNDGKEVLGKDVVADDAFLHGVKFYVEGMEGKVPG